MVEKIINTIKSYLAAISAITTLLLTVIFPVHQRYPYYPYETRYIFGFPDVFLTIFSRRFYMSMGIESIPPLRHRFDFNWLQMIVNILVMYLFLRFLLWVCERIYNWFIR